MEIALGEIALVGDYMYLVLTMDRKNTKQKLIVNLFQVHSEKSDLIWFRICMHEKMGPVKILLGK